SLAPSLPCSAPPRALRSFPTRRSSDLAGAVLALLAVRVLARRGKAVPAGEIVDAGPGRHAGRAGAVVVAAAVVQVPAQVGVMERSEEHTSELQSRENLVCRLLLEKKTK